MIYYLLDTNAVIAVTRNRPPQARQRLRRALAEGAEISASSIVLYELWYGVARCERVRENAERLRFFLSGAVTVMPFAEEEARAAGDVRASLEKTGTPIGPDDILIAAQALRARATLGAANISEFARVRGLLRQDRTSPA